MTPSRLVLQDAMRRYAVGAAIVVAMAGYMARAWPPHEVVAAIASASPGPRAIGLGVAALVYALASRPVADQMLASERLAYWWHLPLSPTRWRSMHLRHLAILHVGIVAVVSLAFGLGSAALAWSVLALSTFVSAHVWATAWRDRGFGSLLGLAIPVALAAIVVASESRLLAAALSGAMLALAWRRSGRPFPERPSRSGFPRLPGGGPGIAVLRLYALVLLRRHALAVALVVLVQALGGWAVMLGVQHVGEHEPDAVLALGRGVAVGGAALASGLNALVHRSLSRDRAWLDASGLPIAVDLAARLGVGVVVAIPSLAAATAMSSLAAVLDVVACGLASVAIATSLVVMLSTRPLRALAAVGLSVAVLTLGGPVVLLAAPLLAAGAHRTLRHEAHTRRRFETYRQDDDHGG